MTNHPNRRVEHYRLGSITTGITRPLIRVSDDEVVAYVESDAGPALVGQMSERQAYRRFPSAFD